jgi:hypothetical protein
MTSSNRRSRRSPRSKRLSLQPLDIIGRMKIDMLPPPQLTIPGGLEIRIMTPEEVEAEKVLFAGRGAIWPNPTSSVFMGAFKDGKRVAFLVLQVQLHAEPLYIEEGHSGVLSSLVSKCQEYILDRVGPCAVYLFAPAGRITQLATSYGFKLEPWNVMSCIVQHPEPVNGVGIELMPESESVVQ